MQPYLLPVEINTDLFVVVVCQNSGDVYSFCRFDKVITPSVRNPSPLLLVTAQPMTYLGAWSAIIKPPQEAQDFLRVNDHCETFPVGTQTVIYHNLLLQR